MRTDHPVHRIGEIQAQLLAQMIAQRSIAAGEIIDPAVVTLESYGCRRRRPSARPAGVPSPAPPGS